MSIGIVFAKGTYEEGEPPELLTTEYTEPSMTALMNLATTTPTLPNVNLPSYPTLPSYPNLPSLNLPGMTGEEKQLLNQGMSLIQKLISGEMPEAYTLGMEKIKSVLGGEYNPLTSPYYKGLKEEAARFEEKGISDIRQRSQLGGMLYSEPAMGAEAEFKGILGTGLTKELGSLYESDVNRQVGMIPQLLSYANLEASMPLQALSGISALSPLAGKGGDITRQQALINQQTATQQALGGFGVATQQALGNFGVGTQQALSDWQVETQQALFPYQYQAPVWESLANWGTWYTPQKYYQPGILDYALPIIGAAAAWM